MLIGGGEKGKDSTIFMFLKRKKSNNFMKSFMYIYMYIHIYVHLCVCIYIYKQVDKYICIHELEKLVLVLFA